MQAPLVTIIGLSYNQAPFIAEALDSIAAQTYANLQVILVDDASPDNSACELQKYARQHPTWQLLLLEENLGNTRAFNKALQLARGEYIIDFALDDVLHPERVARQVHSFKNLPENYGVLFTDCELINPEGELLGLFYGPWRGKKVLWPPPQGDVFAAVLGRTFISPPTMMIRKKVFDELGGYDESLAYEDFDFWVRSSRDWYYAFLDMPLTKKRIWPGSMSQKFYRGRQLSVHQTTLKVCQKAARLIKTQTEKEALIIRVRFQVRQALYTAHAEVLPEYAALLKELNAFLVSDRLVFALGSLRLPLAGAYRLYHKWRGSKQIT